jgi:hypothetical protein
VQLTEEQLKELRELNSVSRRLSGAAIRMAQQHGTDSKVYRAAAAALQSIDRVKEALQEHATTPNQADSRPRAKR